jgi:protease IV
MQRLLVSGWILALLAAAPLALPAQDDKPAEASRPEPQKLSFAHIELEGDYPEGATLPGLFGDLSESMSDLLARLDKAAGDKDVKGVVLRINGPALGWGKLGELRQAIERVRSKDKKVYAWLDTVTNMDYLLAASCDEIIMPESGMVMLVGLRAEVTFYKNLLDMLDVKADMLRVGEFKSAAEPFTRTSMSDEFRQEMEAMLDDYYAQIVESIAQGRDLDPEKVKAAIDSGPHTPEAAKKLGLIDHIAYEDQLDSLLTNGRDNTELDLTERYGKKKLDTDFSGFTGMMKMMNLLMGIEPQQRSSRNPKIAVIYASGMIMTGESEPTLFGGAEVLGSETFIKAVEKARDDKTVKAIVVRVDSPGGSALASDLMWRALEQAQADGKPVFVSMGDVAASGGYYISMGAKRIFAQPGTLTGSIGVVGGKFGLDGLFQKVGITTEVISRGQNSGILSLTEGFSESERQAMMKLLQDIYAKFTRKAAEGREMKLEALEKLARGRVWTGSMAVKNGLVDELGTLEDAIAYAIKDAKDRGAIEDDAKVDRLILPKATSPLEALFGPLDPDAAARARVARREALLEAVTALSPEAARHLQALSIVNLLSREPRLTLMPFQLRVR